MIIHFIPSYIPSKTQNIRGNSYVMQRNCFLNELSSEEVKIAICYGYKASLLLAASILEVWRIMKHGVLYEDIV